MEITEDVKNKKAYFMYMRESIGYSRERFAEEFGISDRSVRRWESPTAPYIPAEPAVELLEELKARMDKMARYSVRKVEKASDKLGERPAVDLYYYPTQSAYEKAHPKEEGFFGFANAITRKVSEELKEKGYQVRIHFK